MVKRSPNAVLAGYAILLLTLTVSAQEISGASARHSQKLPAIVVTGARVERSILAVPASVDPLEQSEIQDGRPLVNLSESLARIPGVVVQNRQNYAQDLQISSRGFGARATFGVRGIRLIVDDIPATAPDGQGQAATISLGSIERIEVLRGPFSAIYGNASGGVIQAFTESGPPQPTLTARVLAGGFQTRREEIKMAGESGGVNYMGDWSRFRSDGYRDHSLVARDHGNWKLRYRPSDKSKVTIVANYLRQPDTEDPLGLTRNQVDSDPRQADSSAVTFNTRKSIENAQAGVVYEHGFSEADTLRVLGYTGSRRVLQFLALTRGAQIPVTSSGGVVDLDRGFRGMGLRWTHKTNGVTPLTMIAGVDYDHSKERRKGYENFVGDALGVVGQLRRDEDDTVQSFDQYLQGEWQVSQSWLVSAGIRNSEVRFDSRDFFLAPGNPDDSGGLRYRHVNPVIGLLYKVTPTLSLYGNYGRGFETPTFAELAYRPDGSSGLNIDLIPSNSSSVEMGVKRLTDAGASLKWALFSTRTKNEIVPATNAGGRATFQNASRTSRSGMELSVDIGLHYDLNAYAAFTYLDTKFKEGFSYRASAASALTIVAANATVPGVARNAG